MSDRMLLLYARQTRNVLGAVAMTAPPAVGLQVEDVAGAALPVRYGFDTAKSPPALIISEALVPADELAVAPTAFKADVLENPHAFVLDINGEPVAPNDAVILKKTTPDRVTVSTALGADLGGVTIFLQLTPLGGDPALSRGVPHRVPVASTPKTSVEVSVGNVVPVLTYTILGLATGFRPAMIQESFP